MRKLTKTTISLAATGALVLGGAAFGVSAAQADGTVHTVSSSSSKIPARSPRSPRSSVATPR
ncbi:hypothetical protein P9139_05605 [Curtobacterium flaccumfaciens]|nr:hypothetical protein P9139_05605 [Curtobacterium flaccumfaciens]